MTDLPEPPALPQDDAPADDRFGPGVPYDDVFDADGNLLEPGDLDDTLDRLRQLAGGQ